MCAPSRGVLLTGKYTIHNGLKLNGDDLPAPEVTIAEALKPLGYDTALIGKWHHGKRPEGQAPAGGSGGLEGLGGEAVEGRRG